MPNNVLPRRDRAVDNTWAPKSTSVYFFLVPGVSNGYGQTTRQEKGVMFRKVEEQSMACTTYCSASRKGYDKLKDVDSPIYLYLQPDITVTTYINLTLAIIEIPRLTVAAGGT